MKLEEFPGAIHEQTLAFQLAVEERDKLLDLKKEADIDIERKVQSLDSKLVKNENQREIFRFDFRDDGYRALLEEIANILADYKAELQFLRDSFAVAKLELQDQISTHY